MVVAGCIKVISGVAANYSPSQNGREPEDLPARCQASVLRHDGHPILRTMSIVYIFTGNVDAELSRRVGAARSELD
eukprot:8845168-Pyramimonas_sp.AAC.1